MGISLIYNPYRPAEGGEQSWLDKIGQVGGLGVQNYPHTHLSCYYLLLKVKVVVMMTKKTFYSNREQSKCHPSKYSHCFVKGIVHGGRGLKPLAAVSPNPWGQNFRPNFVSLCGFQTPPTKMSHPIISQNMRFYKRKKKL